MFCCGDYIIPLFEAICYFYVQFCTDIVLNAEIYITFLTEKQEFSRKKSLGRIKTTYNHWLLNADDAYGFGVIYGLRIAIDVLEGKK